MFVSFWSSERLNPSAASDLGFHPSSLQASRRRYDMVIYIISFGCLQFLAIQATRHSEQSPRVRRLLGELWTLIQEAEGDLGTTYPLDPYACSNPCHFASPSRRVPSSAVRLFLIPQGRGSNSEVLSVGCLGWCGRGMSPLFGRSPLKRQTRNRF
jgi:hypothetical protein